MLTREDNELLCQTTAGTPMGEMLRRFWIPFAMVDQLPSPDCDPIEVHLLGEHLVGFRDSSGRLGLVEDFCPHRGAPLFYGRNEENGLRCIYHGWKFDVDGRCLEMPSEPAKSNFKDKVRLVSYPVREMGNVLWAYMGPKEKVPGLPHLEWAQLNASQVHMVRYNQECNWVQALEGDIDSSHVGFLHRGALGQEMAASQEDIQHLMFDTSPRWIVENTEYGVMLAAQRNTKDPSKDYWRINQWLEPFVTMIPPAIHQRRAHGHMWVPLDDEHTEVWCVQWAPDEEISQGERLLVEGGPLPHIATKDPVTGRLRATKENHFLQSRELQRKGLYSGIVGVREQDTAVVEGMGAIARRWREHLGTSDLPVIAMRRRLVNDAKALAADGTEPMAARSGEVFGVRSWTALLDSQQAFKDNPEVAVQMKARY
ncbi:MAG: Rieske 2Fe-2S domain-containing protein [Chloroflexota bacterium]